MRCGFFKGIFYYSLLWLLYEWEIGSFNTIYRKKIFLNKPKFNVFPFFANELDFNIKLLIYILMPLGFDSVIFFFHSMNTFCWTTNTKKPPSWETFVKCFSIINLPKVFFVVVVVMCMFVNVVLTLKLWRMIGHWCDVHSGCTMLNIEIDGDYSVLWHVQLN